MFTKEDVINKLIEKTKSGKAVWENTSDNGRYRCDEYEVIVYSGGDVYYDKRNEIGSRFIGNNRYLAELVERQIKKSRPNYLQGLWDKLQEDGE